MRFNNGFPPPPWRKPRIFTVRQFLHGVFVASSNPLVNHDVCVHGQGARIAFPSLGSRVISPPLGYSTQSSPDLVRLDPLFPKSTVIERLGAFLEIVRRYECIDHFLVFKSVLFPMTWTLHKLIVQDGKKARHYFKLNM